MTVRMSEQATDHIDANVENGRFDSRAQYLTWLVEREVRRQRDLADLERLRATGGLGAPTPEQGDFWRRNAARSLAHLD